MKICVYGAGAVGGLMAAWLARSGHDVSLVARGAQLEAIRRHGLRVISKGRTESFPLRAESDPPALGPQDYVLVTVKAQNLTQVAEAIPPLLGSDSSVVTAMNGGPRWFFVRLKFRHGSHRRGARRRGLRGRRDRGNREGVLDQAPRQRELQPGFRAHRHDG